MKKKLSKRIFSFVFACLLGGTTLLYASNNNYCNADDYSYTYNLTITDSSDSRTPQREKRTSNSMMFRWDTTRNITSIQLRGYGLKDGVWYEALTSTLGTPKCFVIENIGTYKVANYIKERGCTHARVGVRSHVGNGTVGITWNPDYLGTSGTLLR